MNIAIKSEIILFQDAFYSSLRRENISDEDYAHAKNVWEVFGIRDMGEYHDLYLLSDVLLLTDALIKFRSLCLDNYSLDPWHFHTLPGKHLNYIYC